MTMHAYSELYLDDAMANLGDMMEYATLDLKYDADAFFRYFLTSGIAENFESGNPKYIAGMSGVELADMVLKKSGIDSILIEPSYHDFKGTEYWSGWILAYYQWHTGRRFCDLYDDGLDMKTISGMYILHEADERKFVEAADHIIERNQKTRRTKLQEIRKARGYTQMDLSIVSGVSLRMIQLYEQRQNDIRKARADVVLAFAKALGCRIEDIFE